jgi:hypothetical protein
VRPYRQLSTSLACLTPRSTPFAADRGYNSAGFLFGLELKTAFSAARAWSIWSYAYAATEMTQTDRQGNFRPKCVYQSVDQQHGRWIP